MTRETREFQAEVKRLLDLMIHSLYSNKDVFLRELVSNASDALDRRRFEGLTDPRVAADDELAIRLVADPAERTLAIEDNGIGMSRDELVQHLGTIAKSGTLDFLRRLEASETGAPELIGQFGVGFYSCFMVADRVEVLSRRAGEERASRWSTDGSGTYTIEDAERDTAGTTITLHLLPVDREDGRADYTDAWELRRIVRRYSDFVAYPIRLQVVCAPGAAPPAGADDAPLNSMKAIWTQPAAEVSEQAYREFYTHISHDHQPPLLHLATALEGSFEARALLYVPSVAPFDLYHREMARKGIQLYVRRVFIMDECRELMPEYLRFVKGVVDAEDLSLNVSREMLQQSRPIQVIRNHLVKRVLEELRKLMESDPEQYLGFWAQFGPVLKEGLLAFDERRERILDLLYAASTRDDTALTSLAAYVERMPAEQEAIYYAVGSSRALLARSPHLEAFRARGIEVLLFSDPVDEVWLEQRPPEYRGKRFRSVLHGELELGSAAAQAERESRRQEQAEEWKGLLQRLRTALQDEVDEVRLSSRLTASPACLVRREGELSAPLRAMLRQAGQEVPEHKPVLELNAEHALLRRLREVFAANRDDPRVAEQARLLYAQAVLAEGGPLGDPGAFNAQLSELMLGALG